MYVVRCNECIFLLIQLYSKLTALRGEQETGEIAPRVVRRRIDARRYTPVQRIAHDEKCGRHSASAGIVGGGVRDHNSQAGANSGRIHSQRK